VLTEKIQRSHYVAYVWKHSHCANISILDPTEYGLHLKDNTYQIEWFQGEQIPHDNNSDNILMMIMLLRLVLLMMMTMVTMRAMMMMKLAVIMIMMMTKIMMMMVMMMMLNFIHKNGYI
jgi:hypothetical protein